MNSGTGNRNTHTHTRYRSTKDSLNKSSLHPAMWKHTYGNITRFKLRCVCTRKYHRGNPVNCSWPWLQTFVTQKWQASNLVTAASLDQLSLLSSEKHVSQNLSGRYELFLYGWENDLNSWGKKNLFKLTGWQNWKQGAPVFLNSSHQSHMFFFQDSYI